MRALVQRVSKSSLVVEGKLISEIGRGLIVFLGIKIGDSNAEVDYIVNKVVNLRVFEDEEGKMNLSVRDVGGEIMLVSQFTLYGDVKKGFRPSFTNAEKPDVAIPIYEYFIEKLKGENVTVKKGVFGADMKISYINDGPVSILIEK